MKTTYGRKNKIKGIKGKKGASGTKFNLSAAPLTEEQIKMFIAHHAEHGNFPGLKIPCTVTGKLTTCMGPWMAKKIKEFGGVEELLRNYKCRGAMKGERVAAKPVSIKIKRGRKKVEKVEDEEIKYHIPQMKELVRKAIDDNDISQLTATQCFRPDLYLENRRHCEGCPYYGHCSNKLKCLPKGVRFDGVGFVDLKA